MITEFWKLALILAICFPLDTYVLRPLGMKLFPKYFILHYLGVSAFDIKQIGKQLLKLKNTNKELYNTILLKAKERYNFSIDEKELEKIE